MSHASWMDEVDYRVCTHFKRHNIVAAMVGILLIGDEILSGSVHESNLHLMITTLGRIGYAVGEVRIVRDEVAEIADAFRALRERYEIVISAGGIGPTHDDVTLDGVSAALGVERTTNEEMLDFLKSRYGERLSPMVERMAELPPGTEVLGCTKGHWPVIRTGSAYLLPGLPIALADKMLKIERILPRRTPTVAAEVYLSEDESEFADWLNDFNREYEDVSIGSYPVVGDYDYRSLVVARGAKREAVVSAGRAIAGRFRERGTLVRLGGVLGEEPTPR